MGPGAQHDGSQCPMLVGPSTSRYLGFPVPVSGSQRLMLMGPSTHGSPTPVVPSAQRPGFPVPVAPNAQGAQHQQVPVPNAAGFGCTGCPVPSYPPFPVLGCPPLSLTPFSPPFPGPAWGCPPRTTCCWSTRCNGRYPARNAPAPGGPPAPSPPRRHRRPPSSTGTPAPAPPGQDPPGPLSTSTGPTNGRRLFVFHIGFLGEVGGVDLGSGGGGGPRPVGFFPPLAPSKRSVLPGSDANSKL